MTNLKKNPYTDLLQKQKVYFIHFFLNKWILLLSEDALKVSKVIVKAFMLQHISIYFF